MIKKLHILYYKSPKLIFGLFLGILFFSCNQNANEEAELLVEKAIEAHGGQALYSKLEALSFVKTTRLFLEDGSIESEIIQKQSFQLSPKFLVQIEWISKNEDHSIYYDGQKTIKTVLGQVVTDSLEIIKAENAAKAAAYVFFQPFELKRDNTVLQLEDDVKLNDSTIAKTISVSYIGDNEDSDKWRYYFDDDYVLVANSVVLTDHNSLIENLKYQNVSGLVFNKYRKSYRVDKLLNKKYLRAEYFYDKISFKIKP